jgi:hypothetical protein
MKEEKIDRKTIKKIANEFAEEFTKKIYYKTLMLKFLPEVKAIERKMSKPRASKQEAKHTCRDWCFPSLGDKKVIRWEKSNT